ncbi:MAG TPA: pyridoxamine kinase [Clostridiales bacterium]|nr:pyridoxamine kinase [Clostridiales bacterium]
MEKQKRVAAIHDISGFGKCSLTVALPIISACGIETAVMPTAVLSTHTSGFTGYTFRDLTEDMLPFARHWKENKIEFDAIYTGFLGSNEQIDIVAQIFDIISVDKTVKIVDPAMADNGNMYAIFNKEFARNMANLCKKADIIIPNFTEAAFMLGEEFVKPPYTVEYVEGLIKRLSKHCDANIVLTGVSFDNENLGAACYDKETDKTEYAFSKWIEGAYHGTGDVFASVFTGVFVNGKTMLEATEIAVNFTQKCIVRTQAADMSLRYGVDFERGLWELGRDLLA